MRSDAVKTGTQQAPHRSLFNALGMTKEETALLRKRIHDENSKNIGLPNINRRLMLKYGSDSALHISSKKGMGTVISFHIPHSALETN